MYPEKMIDFHKYAYLYASKHVLLGALAVPRDRRRTGAGQSRSVTTCHAGRVRAVSAFCPHRLRTDCGHPKAMRMPSRRA